MSKGIHLSPTITGDVAVDTVTVNAKGGSYSAILKRTIREGLGETPTWFGANMEFEPGISCVLMAPGRVDKASDTHGARKFRVKRVSPHRYVIDFESEEGAVIDPVIRSVLSLLEELVKAKKLSIESGEDTVKALEGAVADGKKQMSPEARKRYESGLR